MRYDIALEEQTIRHWIEHNHSKAFICSKLQCKPETLNRWLEQFGIDYKGNQGNKGHKPGIKKLALEWCESKTVNSYKLKNRLFEDGIFEKKCYSCNRRTWLGKPIPLELHHKDGDRTHNKKENLNILCSNCHSLTPNYSGKAIALVA